MANRFWVGGSGNWDATDTTHWAATSGGAAGASAPTSADDVVFDAASNTTAYTVTVTGVPVCKNMSFLAAPSISGTISFNGTVTLAIHGNIVLLAGMNFNYTGGMSFLTAGGTKTITSNGATLRGQISIGAATTVQLADNLQFNGSAINGNLGTWDVNGKSVTCRTEAGSLTLQGTLAFVNLTVNPRVGQRGDKLIIGAAAAAAITCSSTLTLAGNSLIERLSVETGVIGTARVMSAAVAVLSNVNFTDITAAGAAIPFTGASIGDGGGNTNITPTAAVNRFWVGGTGFWANTGKWAATSGGASGASVPLPQDNVTFDQNSAAALAPTITCDMPFMGKDITFTGTWNPVLVFSISVAALTGSLQCCVGMTSTSATAVRFQGRGAHTITSNGVSFGHQMLMDCGVGSYTLADPMVVVFTGVTGGMNITSGTFNTGNFAISVMHRLTVNGGTINLGSSTVTLPGTGNGSIWNYTSGTVNAGTSTILINTSLPGLKGFGAGAANYNIVQLSGTGRGAFTITPGAGTIAHFIVDTPPHVVNIAAGSTLTVGNLTISGRRAIVGDQRFVEVFSTSVAQHPTATKTALNTLTGDLQIDAGVALDDYTPTSNRAIVFKGNGATIDIGLFMQVTTGRLVLQVFDTTATQRAYISTVSPVVTDGAKMHFRATLDVNNGAGGSTATFYTSPDGSVWTQLGATVTIAATITIRDTVGSFWLAGADAASPGSPFLGQLYYIKAYSGIGGVLALNFDPNDFVSGGFTWVASTTGETWTLAGSCIVSATNMIAVTNGTVAGITKTGGGTVVAKAISLRRSTGLPVSTFFADANSLNVGNNTNWTFGTAFNSVGASAMAFTCAGVGRTVYRSVGAAAMTFAVAGVARTVIDTLGSAAMAFTVDGEGETGYNWFDAEGQAQMTFAVNGKYLPLPEERIFAVPAEARRHLVEDTGRTYVVEAERRFT